jgi:glycine/D-amino acid oxidase-like deaminating enzyme
VIEDVDVVVIGSGAFGASTAFHLARLGKQVAVVEKGELASQTSPRAAGLAMQVHQNDASSRLAIRSVEKIESFTEETGQPLTFHQTGSIKLARTPDDAKRIHHEIARGRAMDVEIELIGHAEARQLAPFLHPDGALALWYAPGDLFLEPGDLPRAYLRAAEKLGTILLPHTTVTGLGIGKGRLERVVTSSGEIRTPVVVSAAGPWTNRIAEMVGIRIPLWPVRHQLYITEPIEGITNRQPAVRVIDVSVYVRPERGGLMLGGYEARPLTADARSVPVSLETADVALDMTPLQELTKEVRNEFPVLQGAQIDEFRGGLPTMTPDGRFIIDQVPTVQGFFVAGGCNVSGLSTSPAVGEALASWIVDGRQPIDLSSFHLSRFGKPPLSDARLRDACVASYAHRYARETIRVSR